MGAAQFIRRLAERDADPAMVWQGRSADYRELTRELAACTKRVEDHGVPVGAVVSLEADFSPRAVALLLALAARGAIVVPLTAGIGQRQPGFRRSAEVETVVTLDASDAIAIEHTGTSARHPLIARLRSDGRPGLVLFSSGSTGEHKAILHDFDALLERYRTPRPALCTLNFLLFDHIGGINTLLHTLANGGLVVTVRDRHPDVVCAAIERYRVELLPTSPTFLNLILASEAWRRHDLGSLRVVTYGTEVMPESTLERLHRLLPEVRLLQTYGLSELGILSSASRSSDSLWVRLGGDGFATRVVDGMLQVKARSAMLGYLNAPDPFTPDGWFPTGDAVETDGEYFRILGRGSEQINVGGEKVYPAEVESVLQSMPGVIEVSVAGEPHPLTGAIVTARVRLGQAETRAEFRKRMHAHCRTRLSRFKIPQKVELVDTDLHGTRFKKIRRD